MNQSKSRAYSYNMLKFALYSMTSAEAAFINNAPWYSQRFKENCRTILTKASSHIILRGLKTTRASILHNPESYKALDDVARLFHLVLAK